MKNEIRKEFKKKRATMEKAEVLEKSRIICDLFLKSEIYKNAKVIMAYMPLGNETDTSYIIKKAFRDGKRIVLPVTDEQSGDITPCFVLEDSKFEKGAFSVTEPADKVEANTDDIDVVIVPGIAFDKKGARVGFGKGCYDRFLNKTNAVKVGFCYGFQICDDIPGEFHDVKMDFLFTENEGVKI